MTDLHTARLGIALAEDRYRFSRMGAPHARMLTQAITTALGGAQ